MPIRVEYGPSAVAVGELAFRTGQNEYIAKRRKEMEELAQRQAEMRQRGQIQQQNLQADLFKFHGQQQRAMQELQLRQQQFQQQGQQFEQGQQHDLKLAEDRRKHDLDLQKVYGERQVADARMRHGLATQRDFNTFKRNQYSDLYKTKLNEQGQLKLMELLKQREDLGNDTRVPPEEMERSQQELDTQIESLAEDPQYTIAADQQVGYEEHYGPRHENFYSNTPYKRTRNAQGGWDYQTNYEFWDSAANDYNTLTQEEWEDTYRPKPFDDVSGNTHTATEFDFERGEWRYEITDTAAQKEDRRQAAEDAAKQERQKLYGMYQADKQSSEQLTDVEYMSFNDWLTNVYQLPGGVAPAPAGQPAPAPAPEAAPAPAAVAPPQPAPAPAAPEQPAPQPAAPPVEQTPPEQQVQPDQPAGNVQNPAAPLGTQQNPHQVLNQAEAEQMVLNGDINPGDIVTTADGIQFSAGEPQEPVDMMQLRREHRERITREREERQAREAESRAREDAAMAEQAEAQRLDAIEAAKREPSIYTPLEQRQQQEDADYLLQRAGISKEEAEAMDEEYRRQNAAIAAGSPGGKGYETPMQLPSNEPQITGHKLRDGKMEPTMAPGREYMAELERRDAEMRDQAERIDYQPAQEDVSKYGIKQTWETRFGQGPPTMKAHSISSPAGQGKVEYHPSDQYKVAVYPGAEIADQSTMEGISLQMQYNTSAWQRDPNHRVERVSAEQLMDQTRRKLNPQPKWQGPLQGF
jgi:hypothetical protein